ncbi:hypothetical protein EVAR_72290_1 [Eumeta japonica]|uniref:Uncharacterized protein n=1 Tax=Eumeta variegata TaxID=151549 RepID=A0A4C1S7D5_EUMVA|nr:hypothetical protein EVAR_72290_1 [Eumeta japonica]
MVCLTDDYKRWWFSGQKRSNPDVLGSMQTAGEKTNEFLTRIKTTRFVSRRVREDVGCGCRRRIDDVDDDDRWQPPNRIEQVESF